MLNILYRYAKTKRIKKTYELSSQKHKLDVKYKTKTYMVNHFRKLFNEIIICNFKNTKKVLLFKPTNVYLLK